MTLFLQSIYLSAALSLVYIFLLYRSNPHRHLPAAPTIVAFAAGMAAVVLVAAARRIWQIPPIETSFGVLVVAATIEEVAKLLAAGFTVFRFRFPIVAEPLDVAILLGVVGVGFGVYEDFAYIFGTSYPSWVAGDVGRFREIYRGISLARAFPGHILFNGISGFLLGRALFASGIRRVGWGVGGVAAAVLLHVGFNSLALQRSSLLLLTYIVLLVGVFLVLRRVALRTSPFAAVIRLLAKDEAQLRSWTFERPAAEYLLAEGFTWPGKGRGGLFQFYPVIFSLCVLFPLLLIVVYFANRLVTLGA